MKRRLLHVLAGVSMLLCIAVLIVRFTGGWRDSRFHRLAGTDRWEFTTAGQPVSTRYPFIQIVLVHEFPQPVVSPVVGPVTQTSPNQPAYAAWIKSLPPPVHYFDILGFGLESWSQTATDQNNRSLHIGRRWDIHIPYWSLNLLLLILPGIVWLGPAIKTRLRQRRLLRDQIRQGLICANCGYDMRATQQRCPECGTAPQNAATLSA